LGNGTGRTREGPGPVHVTRCSICLPGGASSSQRVEVVWRFREPGYAAMSEGPVDKKLFRSAKPCCGAGSDDVTERARAGEDINGVGPWCSSFKNGSVSAKL